HRPPPRWKRGEHVDAQRAAGFSFEVCDTAPLLCSSHSRALKPIRRATAELSGSPALAEALVGARSQACWTGRHGRCRARKLSRRPLGFGSEWTPGSSPMTPPAGAGV